MAKAAIYCRVSTVEQTQNLSLETQERECRAYCERNGLDVAEVFVDGGASAKTANRPEFQRMLAYCSDRTKDVDFVVVHDLTRFSRDSYVHFACRAVLRKAGVTLRAARQSIDDTPEGHFLEWIFAGVAQLDNDLKARRTIIGMKAAQEKGRWTHKAPIGYLNGSKDSGEPSLIPDPERAHLVRMAFDLAASQGLTKAEILRRVTALGLRTSMGNPVSSQTLGRMLRNPIYRGRIESSLGVSAKGDFEAIITDETYERTQARLDSRHSPARHKWDNPDFPLRRFAACAACGSPLTGGWSKSHTGRRYGYYNCPKCGTSVPRLKAHGQLLDLLGTMGGEKK